MSELLIEIGTEELPALPLLKELTNIESKWENVLKEHRLMSEFRFYYTPRRFVIHSKTFPKEQTKTLSQFIGAPRDVAYKDGKLTPAGLSFLQKAKISEEELTFKEIKGREVLYYQKELEGEKSCKLLASMIEAFLKSLNSFEFIRAIRSLSCVLDDELVEFELYGVKSAKKTFVHRSVSYDLQEFESIKGYFELLEESFVVLDPKLREQKILNEFRLIEAKENLSISKDEELLAEVVAITEYPKALLGSFKEAFLEIPGEVIVTSMRENQRYFALFNQKGLDNRFVVVSNAVCEDSTKIVYGNERVLQARLSDAMFFYKKDLEEGLKPEKLSKITYFEGLGTLKDKSEREKFIAMILCELYQNEKKAALCEAIEYAKADLSTQMVYEFTNLQGIMGFYYAQKMGLSYEVSLAIREQYLPNSEHSALPSTELSSIVSLANKLDTLLGLFSLSKIPSGTKDPYALRRAASGVIKIVLNLGKSFDLDFLFEKLAPKYKPFNTQLLKDFIFERLYTFYELNPSFIKAVLSSKNADLLHLDAALKALAELSQKQNFSEHFSTFKRLANIATNPHCKVDPSLFKNEAEKRLYEEFKKSLNAEDLREKLDKLLALKPFIDDFFDKVMINAEDQTLRNNRQALVFSIYEEFLSIADLKELSL